MNYYPDFFDQLKKEIQLNLPGEQAHLAMSPTNRPLSSLALKHTETIRESAVAVVLFREKEVIHCYLTQRSDYDGKHGGQISFPGGKKDPTDIDLLETARRECFEEIGIAMHEGELLGELTEVFIPVSSFLVKPFVFFHTDKPTTFRNEREVAEIFTFPLVQLMNESIVKKMEINLPDGTIYRNIPYFEINSKKVWGATALILNELKTVLQKITNYNSL
jgi:8-oxo-dGTP pyrophosphatase MutT (NUDIX family)